MYSMQINYLPNIGIPISLTEIFSFIYVKILYLKLSSPMPNFTYKTYPAYLKIDMTLQCKTKTKLIKKRGKFDKSSFKLKNGGKRMF